MNIFKFGFIASLIYTIGDTITTYLNYGQVGIIELNPMMQFLIELGWLYFFTLKIALFLLLVAGTTYLHKKSKKFAGASAIIILAIGIFTTLNNTILLYLIL